MSRFVTETEWEAQRGTVTTEEWEAISALLRRAERELELLVGDLSQHDPELVADTLIDSVAVSQILDNPEGFKSETDGDYTYVRFNLPEGLGRSRFWWPPMLCKLFGDPDTTFCRLGQHGGKATTHPIKISCSMRGWLG